MLPRLRIAALALLLVGLALAAGAPAHGQPGAAVYLPLLARGHSPAFMLADLTPGPEGSQFYDQPWAARGPTLFFARGCGELWRSEGSYASTLRLHSGDAAPPFCPSLVNLTTVGDVVFFVVYRSESEASLWRSDGTVANTRELLPIPVPGAGATRLAIYGLTDLGGELLFFVAGSSERGPVAAELWRSDGSAAGTARVRALPAAGAGSPVAFSGKLFFKAAGDGGETLWESDGSAAGTRPVATLPAIYALAARAGALWIASDGPRGYELWASDGTAAGTRPLRSFDSAFGPAQFVELGGAAYFSLYHPVTPYYAQLWTSDGSAAGTRLVADLQVERLTAHQGALYFVSGQRLHRSDGSAAGTRLVSAAPVLLGGVVGAGPRVYFAGYSPGAGEELWESDGSAAGTRQLQEIGPGPADAGLRQLTRAGDTLYFIADDGQHGAELWALPLAP